MSEKKKDDMSITMEEYHKRYMKGKPLAEQIVQYMHDCINMTGMHDIKDCPNYEAGTWVDGKWKKKLEEIKFILEKEARKP